MSKGSNFENNPNIFQTLPLSRQNLEGDNGWELVNKDLKTLSGVTGEISF